MEHSYYRSLRSISFGLSGASFIGVLQFAAVPGVWWPWIATLCLSIPLLVVAGLLNEAIAEHPAVTAGGEPTAGITLAFGLIATLFGFTGVFWCFHPGIAITFAVASAASLKLLNRCFGKMADLK